MTDHAGTRPLRILVDTLPIQPDTGGQRVYVLNLLRHMAGRTDLECHLVCSRSNEADFAAFPAVRRTVLPWPTRNAVARVVTQQVVLPAIIARARPDVIFAPRDVAPLLVRRPIVTAILSGHLNYEHGVTRVGGFHNWYRRIFVRMTLSRSVKVIAISRFVGRALEEAFPDVRGRVEVVYLGGGVGESWTKGKNGSRPSVVEGERVVLFVSSLFPHKNVEALLRAYARVASAPELVIVGKDVGGERRRLEAIAESLGIGARVVFAGRASDEELIDLYRRAELLVYPSRVEGFGIPLVEAMWFGVPIVASNRTSVPEVAGDAAVIVDPDDLDGLARAIESVLSNEALRKRLVEAGVRRRTMFSWERTASETVGILRDAASGRRPVVKRV